MRVLLKSPALPLLIGLALAGPRAPARLSAQGPVARAVLFYSPTCPHCHKVMTEDLPPLAARYGDRLLIVGVDVSSRGGQEMFQAALAHFGIPLDQAGVPMLVAGEEVMIGSLEIPQRFPGLIERALAADGIDWPDIAPLRQALAAQGMVAEETAPPASVDSAATANASTPDTANDTANASMPDATNASAPDTAAVRRPPAAPDTARPGGTSAPAVSGPTAPAGVEPRASPHTSQRVAATPAPVDTAAPPMGPPADSIAAAEPSIGGKPPEAPPPGITRSLTPGGEGGLPSLSDRLRRDPFGNVIAVAVLVLLVAALAASVRVARSRSPRGTATPVPAWLVPLLCVLGMGVAAYLSFVEVTGQEAVCGPVGDCNAVQQSTYARLFGVLPVGVLGMLGYAAIFVTWTVSRGASGIVRRRALELQRVMTFAATAFSVYLTFLEPFVIGATCMWCVSSAVIVGLLLLATSMELRRSVA